MLFYFLLNKREKAPLKLLRRKVGADLLLLVHDIALVEKDAPLSWLRKKSPFQCSNDRLAALEPLDAECRWRQLLEEAAAFTQKKIQAIARRYLLDDAEVTASDLQRKLEANLAQGDDMGFDPEVVGWTIQQLSEMSGPFFADMPDEHNCIKASILSEGMTLEHPDAAIMIADLVIL